MKAPVPQQWDKTPESKRRKLDQKIVIKVRTEENSEKQKTDFPPSDFWSWRKYGKKPIKGSPHPRGYYRCSTSKGCSAKKQVERCRTDASLLIITYTSNHNHPGPDLLYLNSTTEQDLPDPEPPTTTCEEDRSTSEEHPHPLSPTKCTEESSQVEDQDEAEKRREMVAETISISVEEGVHHPCPKLPTEENNGFFDELEELPMSSSCTNILRSNFFDERVLLLPSYRRMF